MLVDYAAAVRADEAWVLVEREDLPGVLVARPEGDHLFVETVAVRPDLQGGDLGRRLMAFTEEKARERGLPEIRLYTSETMWENFSFYEGLGFEETGRWFDEGYRRVFMREIGPVAGRWGTSRRGSKSMSYFKPWSVLIGLVIPFVAVVGGVALFGSSRALVFGMPVVYFWVFLWFVLTSVCLAVSWFFFDREEFENEEEEA